MTVQTTRPLRKDAAANRERLLAAAAEVFAEQGIDACVGDIAARAQIGMGTFYRNFATKQELIQALVVELMSAVLETGRDAISEDDANGLERFLIRTGELQAEHAGCLSALWRQGSHEELRTEVDMIVEGLLRNSQRAGRIRKDVTATDIHLLFFSMRGVIDSTVAIEPEAWRRMLEISISGLRPADTKLRATPLTTDQLAATRKPAS